MLELKNIVKKYRTKKCNDVIALNDINISLDDHGIIQQAETDRDIKGTWCKK